MRGNTWFEWSLVGVMLAAAPACTGGGDEELGECDPACGSDEVCRDGTCVDEENGGGGTDADGGGGIEISLEARAFETTDTGDEAVWESVSLEGSYDEPPVVLATPSSEGGKGDPTAFRIRNVGTDGFEVVPKEPPGQNGTHDSISSTYWAVEPGASSLPDGTRVAAGRVETSTLVSSEGGSHEEVSLPSGFDNPIVLAQLQTINNENSSSADAPSEPWLTAGVTSVSGDSFGLALDGSECTTSELSGDETVGWVAVESGASGSFSGDDGNEVVYETIRTDEAVTGWEDDGLTVEFDGNYNSAPGIVATKQTRNAADGGWLRLNDPGSSNVTVRVDEDQCSDSERGNSGGERAGLVVFSGGLRLQK